MQLSPLSDPYYLIDSHCHLNYINEAPQQISELIEQANQLGIKQMLCVNINQATVKPIQNIIEAHSSVWGSIGLHPCNTDQESIDQTQLTKQTQHPKIVAIGETGLDYHSPNTDAKKQQREFIKHIEVAKSTDLPLIIHTRSAKKDTLDLLKTHGQTKIKGVLHCFTEDLDMAEQAIALGFLISISGIVTFKNATSLQQIVQQLPLEKLLVETDSPYLAPMPFRGKPNQPAYTRYIAEKIATLRQCSLQTVAEQTTQNFYTLFNKTTPL